MPAGPTGPRTESGISSDSIRTQAIIARHLHDDLYAGKFFKGSWPALGQPLCQAGDGYSDPTAADGDESVAVVPGALPLWMAYHAIVTQTALAPSVDEANGYLIATLDGAAGDGIEYVPGGITANSPFATVVKADASYPKIIKCRMAAETVANVADMAIGFRKAEPFQAVVANYDEGAYLNMQLGDVEIHTILNGTPNLEVDTGEDMTDAAFVTAEVWLMGKTLRFFVNGTQYKHTFEFDDDEVVVPFLHTLGVTGSSEWRWTDLTVGPLWHLKKDINRR